MEKIPDIAETVIGPSLTKAPIIIHSDNDCCSIKSSDFFLENMNTEISIGAIAPDTYLLDPSSAPVLVPKKLEDGAPEISRNMLVDGIWLKSTDTT
jgi:hypothetical protein